MSSSENPNAIPGAVPAKQTRDLSLITPTYTASFVHSINNLEAFTSAALCDIEAIRDLLFTVSPGCPQQKVHAEQILQVLSQVEYQHECWFALYEWVLDVDPVYLIESDGEGSLRGMNIRTWLENVGTKFRGMKDGLKQAREEYEEFK